MFFSDESHFGFNILAACLCFLVQSNGCLSIGFVVFGCNNKTFVCLCVVLRSKEDAS